MSMPLTCHLAEESSPLRRWFRARLPKIDSLGGVPPARLRSVVPRRRPDTLPPWLIGMAFDWRLRLGLEVPSNSTSTTAHAGWCRLNDVHRGRGTSAVLAAEESGWQPTPVAELLAVADAAGAGSGGPRNESRLARVAVALARYEACYRGGVRNGDPLLRLGAAPGVEDLLGLCPDAAADEISQLVVAARRGLAPLFPARAIETNPDFTSFGMPADGDLVVDGALLDLKTGGRSRVRVEWLWQLLGYAFLDHDGRHGITHVGLYLSRHAWLGTWSVDELVATLAGEPLTVQDLRTEFLNIVTRRT